MFWFLALTLTTRSRKCNNVIYVSVWEHPLVWVHAKLMLTRVSESCKSNRKRRKVSMSLEQNGNWSNIRANVRATQQNMLVRIWKRAQNKVLEVRTYFTSTVLRVGVCLKCGEKKSLVYRSSIHADLEGIPQFRTFKWGVTCINDNSPLFEFTHYWWYTI